MIINEKYIRDVDDEDVDDVQGYMPTKIQHQHSYGFYIEIGCSNYCVNNEEIFSTEISSFLNNFVEVLEICKGVSDDIDTLVLASDAYLVNDSTTTSINYGGIDIVTKLSKDDIRHNTRFKIVFYLDFNFKNVNEIRRFLQIVNSANRLTKYITIQGNYKLFRIDSNKKPLGGITFSSVFSVNYYRDFDFTFNGSIIHYYDVLYDVYCFFKGNDASYNDFFLYLKTPKGEKVYGNAENVIYRYFYSDYYEDSAKTNVVYLGHFNQLGVCQSKDSYAYNETPRFEAILIMNMDGDACVQKCVSPFDPSYTKRKYTEDIKNFITNTGFTAYLLKNTSDDETRATLIFVSDGTFSIDDVERTIVMSMEEIAQNGYLDDMLSCAMPYDEARQILIQNKCKVRPIRKA